MYIQDIKVRKISELVWNGSDKQVALHISTKKHSRLEEKKGLILCFFCYVLFCFVFFFFFFFFFFFKEIFVKVQSLKSL